jgi:hypothetical protein
LINGINELQDILQNLSHCEDHMIYLLKKYIEDKSFQKQLRKTVHRSIRPHSFTITAFSRRVLRVFRPSVRQQMPSERSRGQIMVSAIGSRQDSRLQHTKTTKLFGQDQQIVTVPDRELVQALREISVEDQPLPEAFPPHEIVWKNLRQTIDRQQSQVAE